MTHDSQHTARAKLLLACRQRQFEDGYFWPSLDIDPGKEFIADFLSFRGLMDETMNGSDKTFGQALEEAYP